MYGFYTKNVQIILPKFALSANSGREKKMKVEMSIFSLKFWSYLQIRKFCHA
jgi:hypothetical protein